MTKKSAQLSLVGLAFASIAAMCVVFVTGRLWHFPLDYGAQEEIPLIQMTLPPFFAILGTAANYLQAPSAAALPEEHHSLLKLMIWGPCILFFLLFAMITLVFHLSNQPGSDVTFSLDAYRTWLTVILCLISLTVPAVSGLLFKARARK